MSLRSFSPLMLAPFFLMACSEKTAPNLPASITIAPAAGCTLLVGPAGGQACQLSATPLNAKGNPMLGGDAPAWTSLTPAIVSVNNTGLVIAHAPGTGTIQVTIANLQASVTIIVQNVPVANLTLAPANLTLQVGVPEAASGQLVATLTDSTGATLTGRPMVWSTTAVSVASVSTTGLVTAVGAGTAYVRASSEGKVDSVLVTATTVPPTVTTGTAGNITSTSATISGNTVTSQGSTPVTARGVCYATTTDPTTAGACVAAGSGTGTFLANLTGLDAGTAYFVRAFATNAAGTAYGNQADFTTSTTAPTPPTVTTGTAGNITSTSATISGNTVTSQGSTPVTARGVCYATTIDPTTAGTCVAAGSGTGTFLADLTGLDVSTAYFVRAYATNTVGTSYGAQVNFTTAAPGFDIAITDAQWTQAVQNATGTIPILRQGRSPVVNVVTTSDAALVSPVQFVLRLFSADGTLYYTDTIARVVPQGATSVATPTGQFLVPSAQVQPGMRWEVRRDPRNVATDDNASNDVFPASGHQPLNPITPPVLRLRFVPITLTAHGGVTGNVTALNVEQYLQSIRALIPHGELQVEVASTPFATTADFGTLPSGGTPAFWTTLLPQLDAARVADPANADAHWIGVVAPPPGFNFMQNGGWGYIPNNGTSTGLGTRTFAVINVGWFSNTARTRELVAHELGHNLGRQHAPCGGAGSPDASYPNATGTTGAGAHNTYAWQTSIAGSAAAVADNTGDVMGYCSPVWISAYSYGGMLNFRGSIGAAALQEPQPRQRVLLIQGQVEPGGVRILPPQSTTAPATPDDPGGAWTLEGRDPEGTVLFRRRFTPGRWDHADDLFPFGVAVPVTSAMEAALASLHVTGPTGMTELRVR